MSKKNENKVQQLQDELKAKNAEIQDLKKRLAETENNFERDLALLTQVYQEQIANLRESLQKIQVEQSQTTSAHIDCAKCRAQRGTRAPTAIQRYASSVIGFIDKDDIEIEYEVESSSYDPKSSSKESDIVLEEDNLNENNNLNNNSNSKSNNNNNIDNVKINTNTNINSNYNSNNHHSNSDNFHRDSDNNDNISDDDDNDDDDDEEVIESGQVGLGEYLHYVQFTSISHPEQSKTSASTTTHQIKTRPRARSFLPAYAIKRQVTAKRKSPLLALERQRSTLTIYVTASSTTQNWPLSVSLTLSAQELASLIEKMLVSHQLSPPANSNGVFFVHFDHMIAAQKPLANDAVVQLCVNYHIQPYCTLVGDELRRAQTLVNLTIDIVPHMRRLQSSSSYLTRLLYNWSLQDFKPHQPLAIGRSAKICRAPIPHFAQFFMIQVFLPLGQDSVQVFCENEMTIKSLFAKISEKSQHEYSHLEWCLKLIGLEEYIVENVRLDQIIKFHTTLRNGHLVKVMLVPKEGVVGYLNSKSFFWSNTTKTEQTLFHYEQLDTISWLSIADKLSINIHTLIFPNNISDLGDKFVVAVRVMYAEHVLSEPIFTQRQAMNGNKVKWNEILQIPITIDRLSQECYLSINVLTDQQPFAWINIPLSDRRGFLKSGDIRVKLWSAEEECARGTRVEPVASHSARLRLTIPDYYDKPVSFLNGKSLTFTTSLDPYPEPNKEEMESLECLQQYPFISQELESTLLWQYRYYLAKKIPKSVPLLLRSFAPLDIKYCSELAEYVQWLEDIAIPPIYLLECLSVQYSSLLVRSFAVNRLSLMTDEELSDNLLQMVHCLKFEEDDFSPLSDLLLKKALKCPFLGQQLFWLLVSDLHEPVLNHRFTLLLECYLKRCGRANRNGLLEQVSLVVKLRGVADEIKSSAKEKRADLLKSTLESLVLPNRFSLPLSLSIVAHSLVLKKCRVLGSSKTPLFLQFDNHDPNGEPIQVVFKVGDDLRQDQLTLTLFSVVDQILLQRGVDLHLSLYRTVCLGNRIGMIEVVSGSETLASIQEAHGGTAGAFKDTALELWLRQHNPSEPEYLKAIYNFKHSLAGYCVLTYVLGIGDRHNDNLMMRREGHFFHIDFGHFLGHVKRFLGINRDKSPFVLTPEFVHVLGGVNSSDFEEFSKLCCLAFQLIRANAHILHYALRLMLGTAIPELNSIDDVNYVTETLVLSMTESEAEKYFLDLIKTAVRSRTQRLNHAAHIFLKKS